MADLSSRTRAQPPCVTLTRSLSEWGLQHHPPLRGGGGGASGRLADSRKVRSVDHSATYYSTGVGYHISYHISNIMICDNITISHYHITFFPAQCPISHKYHYHIQYDNIIFEYDNITILSYHNITSAVAPSARLAAAPQATSGPHGGPMGPQGPPWGPMGAPQPPWGPIMGPHGGHYHNIISRYVIW